MARWALAELPVAIINLNANEDQGSERLQNGFVMIISGLQWREVLDQVLSCVWCLRLWRSKAHFLKWGHIKRCGHVVLKSERGSAPSFHLAHFRIEVHARIPLVNTGKQKTPQGGVYLFSLNKWACMSMSVFTKQQRRSFWSLQGMKVKVNRMHLYLWICIVWCLPGSIIFFI